MLFSFDFPEVIRRCERVITVKPQVLYFKAHLKLDKLQKVL